MQYQHSVWFQKSWQLISKHNIKFYHIISKIKVIPNLSCKYKITKKIDLQILGQNSQSSGMVSTVSSIQLPYLKSCCATNHSQWYHSVIYGVPQWTPRRTTQSSAYQLATYAMVIGLSPSFLLQRHGVSHEQHIVIRRETMEGANFGEFGKISSNHQCFPVPLKWHYV